MWKLLALILPLSVDTFAVTFAVLGEMRLTRAQQIRITVIFIAFEAGMPLAGMALGAPLAHLAGSPHMASTPYLAGSPYEAYRTRLTDQTHLADTFDLSFAGRYIFPIVIPVVLGGLGVLMLDEAMNDDDDDDDEAGKARALVAASGLAIIGLGLGISLDELVVGFTISFTSTLPIADVITAIAIQSFLAIMAGQYVGRKVRTGRLRLSSERITTASKLIAGGVLVTLAAVLLVGPLVDSHLLPHILPHHKVHASWATQQEDCGEPGMTQC
jgi:manganese efflux pump family protein